MACPNHSPLRSARLFSPGRSMRNESSLGGTQFFTSSDTTSRLASSPRVLRSGTAARVQPAGRMSSPRVMARQVSPERLASPPLRTRAYGSGDTAAAISAARATPTPVNAKGDSVSIPTAGRRGSPLNVRAKHSRETSWASPDFSSNFSSPIAAKVAWEFARAMDRATCGTPSGLCHGASSPTASTRLSSVATTARTDGSAVATRLSSVADSADDDFGGRAGSRLKQRKPYPEVLVRTKDIDSDTSFLTTPSKVETISHYPQPTMTPQSMSPRSTMTPQSNYRSFAFDNAIHIDKRKPVIEHDDFPKLSEADAPTPPYESRRSMSTQRSPRWVPDDESDCGQVILSATTIIREQAESIERSRDQLHNQIERIDKLLHQIGTARELQAQLPAYSPADTPKVRCRRLSATLPIAGQLYSRPPTRSPSPCEAKLISVTQGARYTLQATPPQSWRFGVAPLSPLIGVGRAEPEMSEQELRIHGARSDLTQAIEEAQNVRASQADLSILIAAKGQLISDLANAKELGLPEEELVPAELQRRKLHNAIQDLKGQVRVFCRIRPLNEMEKHHGDAEKLLVLENDCVESPIAGVFSFNGVFSPGTQADIFDDCKDLVQSAVDGHNVTIFSYGQTGAGKTFTMYGTPGSEGIAFRMVEELFSTIGGLQSEVTVEGSIAEIYNNRLIDLLRPTGRCSQKTPRLRQVREGQVQIEDLSQWRVSNVDELKDLIEHGFTQRSVAETVMNIQSSRSHLILTVKVVRVDRTTGEELTGKLVFCDLGGSERLKKTEAVGDRRKEAIEINKSLAALGDVIEAVASKRKHVPYRNHTLTRILQDSLGGTAKTLMFVHCSPAQSCSGETAMSLKFAGRAGRIFNTPCGSQKRSCSV